MGLVGDRRLDAVRGGRSSCCRPPARRAGVDGLCLNPPPSRKSGDGPSFALRSPGVSLLRPSPPVQCLRRWGGTVPCCRRIAGGAADVPAHLVGLGSPSAGALRAGGASPVPPALATQVFRM